MYDVRLLQVLREIARRGSFSAAAEALNYTQPAVSQQVARLERQTGVTLVDRTSRGIRLTTAGQALLRRTERVLAELQAAEDELGEIAAEARGRLRVAGFSTAAGPIVPGAGAGVRAAAWEWRRSRPRRGRSGRRRLRRSASCARPSRSICSCSTRRTRCLC